MIKSVKGAISVISIAVLINLLTGCGGTSSSNSSGTPATSVPSFSVSGVVSDGAIEDAKVWLDFDNDGEIDPDEPVTSSDSEGNFNIEVIGTEIRKVVIKAMGGIDTGTNLDFQGIMEAESLANSKIMTQMLTPLTTLKSKGDLTDEDIRSMFPDLPAGDINTMNPNLNKEVERVGMVVHNTIAQLTSATKNSISTETVDNVYEQFASKLKDEIQAQIKFEDLPLDEILTDPEVELDSEKAAAIQSMIKDTTKQMMELNLKKIDNDERLKQFHVFAMRDAHSKIDQIKTTDQVDMTVILEESKQIRDKMIKDLVKFSVNGVISNGAVSGAEVWLDFNNDGIVDDDEPSTISDASGNFTLDTFKDITERIEPIVIKAMGGVDTDTNLDFEGIFEAVSATDSKNLTQMLNPLTTLEAKGMVEEEIRAMFPDLPAGDLDKMNPTNNEILERIGVVVHSTMAQLTQATKQERTDAAISDVYKDFADKFKNNQLDFKDLPLEQIIEESTAEIDPAKAETIKSMIMDTTQDMFDLDITAEDYHTKMKELETFALKDINIDLDNFMNSSMSKEDFMGVTKLVRDGIIDKKIADISGEVTADVTDQFITDNAVQIQNIREEMESEIKADLDFDKQVEGIDPEIVDAVEQQVENQVQKEVRDQIEQTITEKIKTNITTDFVERNSNGVNIDDQAIKDMTNTIKDEIQSKYGFDFSNFYGGFRSRSKVK